MPVNQSQILRASRNVSAQSERENIRMDSTLQDGIVDFPFDPAKASEVEIAVFLDDLSLRDPWKVADALRAIATAKGLKRTNQLLLDRLISE